MNGEKIVSFLQLLFVVFGFELRNSEADETACDSAGSRTNCCATESGHDGTGRNERAYAGNGKRTDAGEQTKRTTCNAARCGSSCGTFGCFGVFDVTNIMRAVGVGQQDGDFRSDESLTLKTVDNVFGLAVCVCDTEYGLI